MGLEHKRLYTLRYYEFIPRKDPDGTLSLLILDFARRRTELAALQYQLSFVPNPTQKQKD